MHNNTNGVKAKITTSSSYISELSPNTSIVFDNGLSDNADITAGYEKYGETGLAPDFFSYYTLKFKVSNSVSVNTEISFDMDIFDDANNSWTDTFKITVQ